MTDDKVECVYDLEDWCLRARLYEFRRVVVEREITQSELDAFAFLVNCSRETDRIEIEIYSLMLFPPSADSTQIKIRCKVRS